MSRTVPEYVAAMQEASFYPHDTGTVFMEETHISRVFLTGPLVYKIKKPVDLGFLDFTTLEKRKYYCHQEVELNRRLSSGIYLGVVPITRQENGFQLDGTGPVVEYAVKMKQLDNRHSLEQMVPDKIDSAVVDLLARTLAQFYETAATGSEIDRFGTKAAVEKNCLDNFRQLAGLAETRTADRYLKFIEAATRRFLTDNRGLLEKRVADGKIRDGHGDLRADHVYFTANGVQIIDCIEFNRRLRCVDVSSDLAFLAMTLDFKGYPRIAGSLVTAFIEHAGDREIFSLLDFYKCYRAMVRVKVNYLRLKQENVTQKEQVALSESVHHHLGLAYRCAIQFSRPILWVVFGKVATGKSTLAGALAEALGITAIRSDVIRKRLFQKDALTRKNIQDFEKGIYSREATGRTYEKMMQQARKDLEKGDFVILDATFSTRANRREALRLAQETGALIVFVESACTRTTMKERLLERSEKSSVSDARIQHLDDLTAVYEEPEELSGQCFIQVDSESPLVENLRTIFTYTATPKDCLERRWLPSFDADQT